MRGRTRLRIYGRLSASTLVHLSLMLTLSGLLSGCSTVTIDCGVPLPNNDVVREMLAENRRAMKHQPLLMPHTYLWHKEVSRACSWADGRP